MKKLIHLAGLTILLSLISCTSTDIKKYAHEKPQLSLEEYFNGPVTGHGLVMDRSGQVLRRFVVKINCSWVNGVGTLDEDFVWSDGEVSKRIWTLRKLENGDYEGRADDILGIARGMTAGNAFNWSYRMDIKTKDSSFRIKFDDWMYLVDDKVLINEATMSWYGFHAGKILISFTK